MADHAASSWEPVNIDDSPNLVQNQAYVQDVLLINDFQASEEEAAEELKELRKKNFNLERENAKLRKKLELQNTNRRKPAVELVDSDEDHTTDAPSALRMGRRTKMSPQEKSSKMRSTSRTLVKICRRATDSAPLSNEIAGEAADKLERQRRRR
eukprot:GEMP01094290.1.p1 GENE.GEMP01094290.1~~GEMP01094290.1.p1  ORF type:complete len:154 (+),score=41.37 GEMP01094290.1:84-545(+)